MPFDKGNQFGRKFKSDDVPWIKGRNHSEESKQKMRLAHAGKILSPEHCANLSVALKGRIFSEEHRRNLSLAMKDREFVGRKCVERVKKICPTCKEIFYVLPSRSLKQFCSRQCAVVGRKVPSYDRKGAKNPKWKGGITPLRHAIWKSEQYDMWRRRIFARDQKSCQGCGTKDGELQVHHTPYEFVDILRDFNIRTMSDAIACDVLWDDGNGKDLCIGCHRKTYRFRGNQYRK